MKKNFNPAGLSVDKADKSKKENGGPRTAFIAISGRPNVGKSSIMNRLLGQKVAIVSSKPQTTRTKIMGVLTSGEDQYVFIDTPGIHRPHDVLGEKMVKAAADAVDSVDVCMLVCDASYPPAETEKNIVSGLKKSKTPVILLLNKIDLVADKQALLGTICAYSALYDFAGIIPVSAKTGDGFDAIFSELSPFLKPSVHFFDDDTLTDQPERVIAAEIIREKLLRRLSDEVPHGIAVAIDRFFDREDGLLDIEATVYCERDGHKGIIIGKGGSVLKEISTKARVDLERFFDCKVNLRCWVKVKENWRNREGLIHNFGLD